MLPLLTVGFIFLEEIEPCQFEIQTVPSQVREVFNSGPWRFRFAAWRIMFYPRSIISLAEPQQYELED